MKRKISILFILLLLNSFLNFHISPIPENHIKRYAPPIQMRYFLFGYNELVADSLWLRVLQGIDNCLDLLPEKGAVNYPEQYDLLCRKSWAFQMLNFISDIVPKFKLPLSYGALTLSIVVNDIEGSTFLFEKATERFPDDWKIRYQAGYHYLYEEKNFMKAASSFKKAADIGAPKWLYSLAAKLYSDVGRAIVGKTIIEDFLDKAGDSLSEGDRKKLEARLKEVSDILEKKKKADGAQGESHGTQGESQGVQTEN